jgi:hypothetical protein
MASVTPERALLRLVSFRHADATPTARDQIAQASSAKATVTRSLAGFSTAKS